MASRAVTVEDRLACIEAIVTLRSSAFDYLASFHTLHESLPTDGLLPRGQAGTRGLNASGGRLRAVWMDSVALTRRDMSDFFERQEEGSDTPSVKRATPPVSPHSTTAHQQQQPAGGLRLLDGGSMRMNVQSSWLSKHLPFWYHLGFGLAGLVVEPAMSSGPQFVASLQELLLELECSSSSISSARRALAQRALRQYREECGVTLIRPSGPSGAVIFNTARLPPFGMPAYLRVVGALLHTLVLVFRKLMDSDIAADDAAYDRFVKFDAAIDALVLQPLSSMMGQVAQCKLAAQAAEVLSNFESQYSSNSEPAEAPLPTSSGGKRDVTHHEGGRGGWGSWLAKNVKKIPIGSATPPSSVASAQRSPGRESLPTPTATPPPPLHARMDSFGVEEVGTLSR